MFYGDIVSRDKSTGNIVYTPVTNDWVAANKENLLVIELDRSQILSDGLDSATLTITLYTPYWVDGTRDIVNSSEAVNFYINEELQTVNLVNGVYSDTITSTSTGTFTFHLEVDPLNKLELEVV